MNEYDDDMRKLKIMLLIIAGLVLFLLFSCSTEKKAQRKVAWLLSKDLMDDNCSRLYPNHDSVINSIHFDTLYVDGEPVILRDTVFQKGDTIIKVITKQCPPERIITKYHDSIIYRTNTAEVERMKRELLYLQNQIKAKDDIIIKQQEKIDKNDWWKMAALITWFTILLGIVFRLFIYKRPI
jgi:hypothetical protein